MRPVASVVGDMGAGKSTTIDSLLGLVSPHSPLHLTKHVCEIRYCKARAKRCFEVRFTHGTAEERDIKALWDTMSEENENEIDRLILYAEPSELRLNELRFFDLPGLKMNRDSTVREFIDRETDILLYVVKAEAEMDVKLFEVTNTAKPGKTVVAVNKIDQLIDWQSPNLCLDKLVEAAENRAREQVDDNTEEVVAVSALLALASELWDDQIFESVVQIAAAAQGDFAVMEKNNYFSEESRQVLLEKANSALKGPWITPAYVKPAFGAIVFSLGLAIHQEISSPDKLRDALREFSGIDRLREVLLLSVSESARITARQEALEAVSNAEEEILGLHQSLNQVRQILEGTDRIASEVDDRLTNTEDRRYFHELKLYLEVHETEIAMCLREKQHALSAMQQANQETKSD